MAKRRGLSELSRRMPSSDENEAVLEQVRQASDISAAITATAIVEARLEDLLIARLKNRSPELMGRIFQNRGPLSDFNSKILLAHAMGVITGPLASELHNIRAIRNAFAEVNSFGLLIAMTKVETPNQPLLSDLPVKSQFLLILRIVLIMFDTLVDTPGTAEEALASVLADSA